MCCTLALIAPASYPPTGPSGSGLRCTLGPRMDFQFLSAPLAGIPLSSVSLRRYLTGTGLARLIRTNFLLGFPPNGGLTRFSLLVRSRERSRKQPGLSGTQHHIGECLVSGK